MKKLNFVVKLGLEPTCNQLPFQQRIRQRVYLTVFVGGQGLEPS